MKAFWRACAFGLLACSTAALADDPVAPLSKKSPQAIRCVRMPVTGTLAQVRKICKTNDEWKRAREDAERVNMQICAGKNCAGN